MNEVRLLEAVAGEDDDRRVGALDLVDLADKGLERFLHKQSTSTPRYMPAPTGFVG